MATTIARAQMDGDRVLPVEVLRSLLPMILAGLKSTQMRIRQSTYRFLVSAPVLGGIRWLKEKDAVQLLRAMEMAKTTLEDYVPDRHGREVPQIDDFGTMLLNHVVESGKMHPTTLKPLVPVGDGDIRWLWSHPDGKQYPLGEEEVFTPEELEKVNALLEARVN
jgi:hypothetical protein